MALSGPILIASAIACSGARASPSVHADSKSAAESCLLRAARLSQYSLWSIAWFVTPGSGSKVAYGRHHTCQIHKHSRCKPSVAERPILRDAILIMLSRCRILAQVSDGQTQDGQ